MYVIKKLPESMKQLKCSPSESYYSHHKPLSNFKTLNETINSSTLVNDMSDNLLSSYRIIFPVKQEISIELLVKDFTTALLTW